MPIPAPLTYDDRPAIQAMGKSGWEALLRTQSPGNYQDPFGDGGTYCVKTADGLSIVRTPSANVSALAPKGYLYWGQEHDCAVYAYQANLDYLLDEDAPGSTPGPV
ncbi:hypothetical protein ACFYNM_21795 [Streptomyces spororaveus]|uniref:hypothetical protein n=1 Tax=Streptomyces spororaveus TaxID=284039 RepID=UPI0036ACE393